VRVVGVVVAELIDCEMVVQASPEQKSLGRAKSDFVVNIVVGYLLVFVGAKGGICGRFQGQGDGWRNDKRRDEEWEEGVGKWRHGERVGVCETGTVGVWKGWQVRAGKAVGDGDAAGFCWLGHPFTTPLWPLLVPLSCTTGVDSSGVSYGGPT
jgi:hypothetical protein